MSDEETPAEQPESETPDTEAPAETPVEQATATAEPPSTSTPDFQEMQKTKRSTDKTGELNRLYDVEVTISAELGKTRVPVQELLGFTEGSVFELNRAISAPIELIAQGVPLGNGEVVVVDDTFAIRIKEIYSSQS